MIQVQATGVFGQEAVTVDHLEGIVYRTFVSTRYEKNKDGDGYDSIDESFILSFGNYKQQKIVERCEAGAWIFVSGTLSPKAINNYPVIVVKTMELKELPPFPRREYTPRSSYGGYRRTYGSNRDYHSHGDISDCDYSNFMGDYY